MNDVKEILEKAGYRKINDGIFLLDGGYDLAKKYFSIDYDMLEFLENLDEEEKENLHFQSQIDLNKESAIYRVGHWFRNTSHLPQLGNGIDNTNDVEDDFEGVIDLFVKEIAKEKEVD